MALQLPLTDCKATNVQTYKLISRLGRIRKQNLHVCNRIFTLVCLVLEVWKRSLLSDSSPSEMQGLFTISPQQPLLATLSPPCVTTHLTADSNNVVEIYNIQIYRKLPSMHLRRANALIVCALFTPRPTQVCIYTCRCVSNPIPHSIMLYTNMYAHKSISLHSEITSPMSIDVVTCLTISPEARVLLEYWYGASSLS